MSLLGVEHNDEVHAKAARAIGELARDHAPNQSAIAAASGIPPLVALLEEASTADEAKEEAASALWSLAAKHKDNQSTIATARGIPPLVTLIGTGDEHAQAQAAGALTAIGLNHPTNQEAISEMLKQLLSAGLANKHVVSPSIAK